MSLTHDLPLVGRENVHAQIIAALDDAARGDGRVLILSGEAGVGKSRLTQDAVAAALARGFRVLSSTGSPIQRDLHYAMLIDILRPLVRRGPHGARAALLDGLPALSVLFEPESGITTTDLDRVESLGDPALERTRIYESVRRLLARAAKQQPLLIVLDDTHWADPGSLAALAYSSWGSDRHSALLVVSRRTGEPDAADEDLIRALRRLPGTVEIEVGPLDAGSVAGMAGQLLGGAPPQALIDLLVERTGGLALFVRAMVAQLVSTGHLKRVGGHWVMDQVPDPAVPAEVREILRARIEALPQRERRIVELIAVSGGSLPHDLLVAASDADPVDLLQKLLDLGLIVEELGGPTVAYRAMHPLLTEVAARLMPEVARRQYHARLAEAIGRADLARLDLLAHHLTGAGDQTDPEATLEVLIAALDSALESRAGAAAVRHADSALALARRLERADDVPSLLERRARGFELAGFAGALSAWVDAAEAHLTVGRVRDWGRLLVEVSSLEWDRGLFDAALEHIDTAVSTLSQRPDGEYLRALTTRMTYLNRLSSPALGEAVEALEAAAATVPHPTGQVGVQIGRIALALMEGNLGAARTASIQLLTAMEATATPVDLSRVLRVLANIELELGDHAGCLRMTEGGIEAARRAGVPTLEAVPRALRLSADLVTCDWTRVEEGIRDVLELGHRAGSARAVCYALVAQSQLRIFRGDLSAALESLEESRSVYGGGRQDDLHLFGIVDVSAALADLAQGRYMEAATRIERCLPLLQASRNIAVLVAGEARCAMGDLEAATALAASLRAPHDRGPWGAAVSSQLYGLVALARGDRAEGAHHLETAARNLDALGLRHPAAAAWLDWASATDDSIEASRVLMAQTPFLDSIGARPLANRARGLLRDRGISLAPFRHGPEANDHRPNQLSAREREIAELVASGLSNADIANRLYISPRTVTTHLHHVYGRLGMSSRTALTRWVLDQHARRPGSGGPDYVPRNT